MKVPEKVLRLPRVPRPPGKKFPGTDKKRKKDGSAAFPKEGGTKTRPGTKSPLEQTMPQRMQQVPSSPQALPETAFRDSPEASAASIFSSTVSSGAKPRATA